MKEWNYIEDVPFIPIKLIGKEREIVKLAIVDTGAKYCVIHEAIADYLELEKIDIGKMIGFGSKKKFEIDLCIGSVEINGRIEIIQLASVKDKNYPDEAPKVIIGRNLLNKFKIVLDGKNKKIYLE
jgi:predicted aspartyl protease